MGFLIFGSQIGLYSVVNLQYGGVYGVEFSYDILVFKSGGWDSYFYYSLSVVKLNGVDNMGEFVDDFNDYDQCYMIGIGVVYIWKLGVSFVFMIDYGLGLVSSVVLLSEDCIL